MAQKSETWEPKNVMVTGACGFTGSNFLRFAFAQWQNANFVNVDKLILNSDVNHVPAKIRDSTRYQLVLADICNSDVIGQILREKKVCISIPLNNMHEW